jgi:hypothetical protein
VTLQVQSLLLAGRAVGEWNVVVGDVFEEMDFIFVQEKTGSNRMYWSIAPTLVEESTILVQRFEKVDVRFRSEPIEVTNFKIGPLEYVLARTFSIPHIHLPYGNDCRPLHHRHSKIP